MTLIKKTNIFKSITSILALDWKTVCDLWQSWAKAALRAVIFCRPSYVSSHWSGSISPRSKSKSTKALSNSFSKISSQRNDRVAAISTSIILHVKQQLLKYLLILPILSVDMIVIITRKKNKVDNKGEKNSEILWSSTSAFNLHIHVHVSICTSERHHDPTFPGKTSKKKIIWAWAVNFKYAYHT